MAHPETHGRVDRAKQRLKAARLQTQQCKERTDKVVASAIALLEKYDQLEQRTRRKSGSQLRGQPAYKGTNDDGVEMLAAMKQALANVESVVMLPNDNEALRNLKSDLRSAVANLQFRKIVSRWR